MKDTPPPLGCILAVLGFALAGDIAAAMWCQPFTVDTIEVFVDDRVSPQRIELDANDLFAVLTVPARWYSLRKNPPLYHEAFFRAATIDIDGRPIRIFSPEYLVAAELAKVSMPAERIMDLRSVKSFNPSIFADIIRRHGLQDAMAKFHSTRYTT
jgi:hypothetical protein